MVLRREDRRWRWQTDRAEQVGAESRRAPGDTAMCRERGERTFIGDKLTPWPSACAPYCARLTTPTNRPNTLVTVALSSDLYHCSQCSMHNWSWKCGGLKCVQKPTRGRLSLTLTRTAIEHGPRVRVISQYVLRIYLGSYMCAVCFACFWTFAVFFSVFFLFLFCYNCVGLFHLYFSIQLWSCNILNKFCNILYMCTYLICPREYAYTSVNMDMIRIYAESKILLF